jgi:hypothetical protein
VGLRGDLLVLTRALPLLVALGPVMALAQRDTTRDALLRLEASLSVRATDVGALARKDLLPAIVVSTEPRYAETLAWYPTAAVGTLVRVFGAASVRVCEGCASARLQVAPGRYEQSTAALDAPEIVRYDENLRGKSEAAKTAIWLDETAAGVSLRIIDLRNSRVLVAENFDEVQADAKAFDRTVQLVREEQRRARGDALAHTFIDIGVVPMQHISLDWSEQWGDTNANLAGVSLSAFDPVLGLGGSYFRITPLFNITVGLKLLVSVPTALVRAISPDIQQIIDPLFTAVLVIRWPIFGSNFGLVATLSTNARVTFGISLLNFSLLPVLP